MLAIIWQTKCLEPFYALFTKGEIYFLKSKEVLFSVKMKEQKCFIPNINVKKSRSTFLSIRILALITAYGHENAAEYVTDINFLITVMYQLIV